jgi:hypothetical protein
VILLLGLFLTMRARTGTAQSNEGAVLPRHVEIKMVAPNESWPALQTVLSELLARLQVSVRFANVANVDARQIMGERSDDPPSVARVWIDMRDAGRVTLYLTGDRADRLLVRHVPLVARVDEVAREEIAHIVEATVDALLVGGRIGVVTDEVVLPSAKAEASSRTTEERRPGISLDLGVGYEAQAWSSRAAPLHSAALFVAIEGRWGQLRPGVWLSGEYRFPTTVNLDVVTARLDQGSVRAVATLEWAPSRKWLLGGGVGGGVDLVHIAPDVNPDTKVVVPTNTRLTVVPMLRALLFAKFALTARSDVFFGIGGDYDLYGTRYFLRDTSGVDVQEFEPWRLRPTGLIGVASDVLAR